MSPKICKSAGAKWARRGARQLVTHGHFLVNGVRVDVPSYRVSKFDTILTEQLIVELYS